MKKVLTMRLEVDAEDVKAFQKYMKSMGTPVHGGRIYKEMRKALDRAILMERKYWRT